MNVMHNFRLGCPSARHRQGAADILNRATKDLMDNTEDLEPVSLGYGPNAGSSFFREQMAKFLAANYNDKVTSSDLLLTAGATHGLHLVTSLLFRSNSPVFVVDPTYFLAIDLLRSNLAMNIIPVSSDEQGICVDDLERLLTLHRSEGVQTLSPRYPFWGMIYLGSVLSNPSNITFSEARCRRLVEVAKKHDVMVFSDDVYNLLQYEGSPPPRLLSFDRGQDGNIGNNVISNGTFSKILCPGIRVGWIEAGPKILTILSESDMLSSGGAVNHYSSQLLARALYHGWMDQHLAFIKQELQEAMTTTCDLLRKHLPSDTKFDIPRGGYYVWVRLPCDVNTTAMTSWLWREQNILVLEGQRCSPKGGYRNCIRLSVTNLDVDDLKVVVPLLCEGMATYRSRQPHDSEVPVIGNVDVFGGD